MGASRLFVMRRIPSIGFLAAVLASWTACDPSIERTADTSTVSQVPSPEPAAPRDDSLARLIAGLDERLAPLTASDDSVVRLLRADSGTVRADSALSRYRDTRRELVYRISRALSDTAFEVIVFPRGIVGDRRRRGQALHGLAVDPIDTVTADSIVRFLDSRGIRSVVGEGQLYYKMDERTLLQRFGPFVTPPMHAYLRMEAAEQTAPIGADGSIGISWDSLAQRLSAADRLLAEHPDVAAAGQVEERVRWYLRAFLSGWDNTSVFESRSRLLKPDARKRFEEYVRAKGSTATGRAVGEYLEVLESTGYRWADPVRHFLQGLDRRRFAAAAATEVAVVPPSTLFSEQPEHIEPGACSGELCMKIVGRQVSYDTLTLYARPDTTSPIVARLAPPVPVTVLERRLHSRPTPFVVRRAHEIPSETDPDRALRYVPGDTLWVLHYIGEEYYSMRQRDGKRVQFALEFGNSQPSSFPACAQPDCWGWMLAFPRTASWLKLRLETGREGWAIPRNIDAPESPGSPALRLR